MSNSQQHDEQSSSFLSGSNMDYLDGLYEDYLADPDSVPATWRDVFSALPSVKNSDVEVSHRAIVDYFLKNADKKTAPPVASADSQQYQVANLINDFRSFGHQVARLDPLDMVSRPHISSLELSYHHLDKVDKKASFFAGPGFNGAYMSLGDIYQALKETYCGSIGIEYMHIAHLEETQWLQQRMESVRGRPHFDADKKKRILKDLIAADGLERYLGTRYVGQKRFSLEGGDSLIPLMNEIINRSGASTVREVVIGMAHRGRLNVLVNVLGKEPGALFQEFEGTIKYDRTGDVKYHLGFSSNIRSESGSLMHLALAFNPSHLEIIGPVVEGSVRSRLRRRNDLLKKETVIPVVLHGDAAFAGQGVVMETFNFSQARGYCTGGTIHVVINNQIGFTTSNPLDARSTLYCTDVAKMVQAPVLHVNGDDPEAVVFATQIAVDYRMKFKRDVVIDLVCYRRNGHNEADEPAVTQPLMYQKIKSLKPLREIYGAHLVDEGVMTQHAVEKMVQDYRDILDQGKAVVDVVAVHPERTAIDWSPYLQAKWTDKVDTTITPKDFRELVNKLHSLPQGFSVHPVFQRVLHDREKMAEGEIPMNWGFAETLAYASLLEEGYGVRLSGQDSGRGTFAHRHAVLHDAVTGASYTPLEQINTDPVKQFTVIDSVLSEEAVLAFEYGFALSDPNFLVIWEAQFGDFANGAQVVIDQFISSGEQKWGRLCGLVMLLPHGYEGQGPEHSSARLERYMQLCAQHNIQVCTPTTPSQIFHLLRRQMRRNFRKPLIVMTPKSLLRHKLAVSPLEDLFQGKFHNVIGEIDELPAKKVTKVILCCGKVYYDLLEKRRERNLNHIAIVRIEQLYPFPKKTLMNILEQYTQAKTIVWCQEEPQNQGVWFSSSHHILECLRPEQTLDYAGRGFAASPAVGSAMLHAQEQKELVEQALK